MKREEGEEGKKREKNERERQRIKRKKNGSELALNRGGLEDMDKGKETAQEAKKAEASEKPQEEKFAELTEKYLRLAAEFDNYKKRIEKEKGMLVRIGEEKAVSALLPVLDDLEGAREAVKEENARKGIEMLKQKVWGVLQKEGLVKVRSEGKFDENLHEAVMSEKGEEEGKITKVILEGYAFRGKVIRHAKVCVSKKEGGN
ncbi:nucleotide exchange factor GrpE [Candidatus Micrarchaeota archaeon CG1_02_47_40]|nr:MAG: nucleotide exchange factor GrpE [Candidatus Micrarchaeota archaeon CG1_02_47_40]